MKNYYYLLVFLFLGNGLHLVAQDSCITAAPFCSNTAFDFDAPTGFSAPVGPDYGCIGSVANPIWFSVEVATPGGITITGNGLDFSTVPAPIDIDYIFWGPFTSLSGACYGMLDSAHIVVCDYSGSNLININIPSALPGQFYIGLISNYANVSGNIHYEQTGGTGSTACGSGCSFASLTAIPTSCDSTDNTYSVSGTVTVYNVPATGTLTIFGSCGGSQTFTAPFTSPINYTLNGLPSNGASCFISAAFSNDSCSINKPYTAPPVCNSSSIQEYFFENFSIVPNPSNGIFNISCESTAPHMNLIISDVLGRVVYHETILNSKGFVKKQVDISEFKKGLYFVQLITDGGNVAKKIIIE